MTRTTKTIKRPGAKTPNAQKRLCVIPAGSGWAVAQEGSQRKSGAYRTQADALEAARKIARSSGGAEVRVQGRDGRWRDSFSLGRAAFAKISAVEGIRVSREIEKDFRTFDRTGVSNEKRRRKIISKYAKST